MWESNKENVYSSKMWESNKENVCHYFGYDRHNLRTLLESKNPNEEDALWEFLRRSAQYLARDPSSECRMFPLKKPSFPLTPIEVFQKTCPIQRRKLFFKSLYQGDILYLKVIEEKTDCFKLLALDKYKGCMKIDDLGIVMDLPKLPQELKHLFPHSFSVIKAALCSGNMKERFMCVTLDKSIVKPEYQDVSLGPVYEPYNMHYHGNPFLGISFTDNLFMTGEIRVRQRLPELSIVGIKEKTEYSHQKKPNKRVFSKSLSRTSLRKRLLQETSSGYYELAVASLDQNRVKQALSHLKQALYVWNEYPEALILAGKCYNIIGDIPDVFLCCMKDFESYPSATAARKHMCMMLVDAARVHLNYNAKSLAREFLEMARIIDPDNENAVRLLKEAKLVNKSSTINPDEKYEFPCPFQNEIDVTTEEPGPRSKKKHHKRKTSKKKHQKHHKSSKLSLSPKKSTHDAPFKTRMKSKFKSQFSESLPTQSEPHENEETMKFLFGLIEKAQAEFRLNRSLQEVMLMNPSGSPHLSFSQEIPLGHSLPFTPSVQSNSNISEFAVSHPVQTSSASTPHENLKTLYDLVETAKREIQIQNQMKASQLTQPSSDTTILHTIISTINKLISHLQDMVKNSSHSSIISESLPLLQSQLLSNQLVAQYPLSQLSEVNQVPPQIESPHPTQTFLSSPLCPDKLQTNQAPMFSLPGPESSSNVPPKNSNSVKQSIVEGKTSVEPNSESIESSNIPFLEYPVSTPGHSKHSILEDQSTSVPVYQDSGPLSMLKTKYFKPLSPSLNQPDMASDTKHAAENVHKSEASLPDSTNQETKSKKKSPEASRRTPQRYRLTPPKKHERNTSRRHRSRSPRRREGGHSHRKRDRSSRRHRSRSLRRSQSPRRRRSRSYSPRRYRSRSSERSRSRSYSRSNSFKRSRNNSLRRSKRSRSGSPAKYRRNVHLGASKRSPSPRKSSLPHSLRQGIRSTLSLDSSSANLCEVVVSSPSFSDSSIVSVSNFESRSPSPCAELTKDIPPETPFLRSTPDDFLDPEISLVGFHRSKSPPWQRHVSITTKPARHKASSSSSSLQLPSKSYPGTSSKESFPDDGSLSPPKRTIPVICSRIMS